MLKKPIDCSGCDLADLGVGFVQPFGTGKNKIAIMGMAPEKDEIAKNEPFVGRAGSVLGLALRTAGLSKTDFIITNALNCKPPDMTLDDSNPWLKGALAHCETHRSKALRSTKLDAIVALGNTPFKLLTGETNIAKKRGYVYWSEEYQCKVIGAYHPSFIGRGKMGLLQSLIYDLKIAPTKPLPTIPYGKLTLYPTPIEFSKWCESIPSSSYLVIDIETPYSSDKPEDDDELMNDPSSQILRVSFGLPDGRAITFPWTAGWIEVAIAACALDVNKVFWNADYDVPRLELNECRINGTIIDAMWLFHFLFPDLPRGLASASSYYTTLPEWKSLSNSQPELYSALDSHATALCYNGIRSHLEQKGMWKIAWEHVVLLQEVLRKMHHRGMLVDTVALSEFQTKLTSMMSELQTKIDLMVPLEARPTKTISAKHLRGACACKRPKIGKKGQPLKTLIAYGACPDCGGTGWKPLIVVLLPFNASSGDQVKVLIRCLGHIIPKSSKKDESGTNKETTEKKFLQQLARQHPTAPYGLILEYRKVAKMRDTYTHWPMKQVSETRAKVATRLTLVPQTGRLASENPNMQNIPKEGELADAFKKCLVASKGHIIVKRDYSGIEAVLTGYFAQDAAYMKLALAGVHAYNCAKFLGIKVDTSVPLPELAKTLKALKSTHKMDVCRDGEDVSLYQRFKKANHMINYGARHIKLYNESPGVFKDLKDAHTIWKAIYMGNPKLRKWHKSIEGEIKSKEHRIITPYMYNRYFWDKSDLPKAIAMKPQSTAAAIIKTVMLAIDKLESGLYMVLQVHDELIFNFPIAPGSCECCPSNTKTWQELDEEVRLVMEAPLAPLGGLVIPTEASTGFDFSCH